ncbi:hypothetical protein ABJ384_05660 [Acinetobacter sp. A1-4-2]|uniref:Uncharacterized protein n=1 Tax=Acinetobacter sp. A1-4-2 TaxID=3156489 RepID=A0AAU7SZJ3_9GAMM
MNILNGTEAFAALAAGQQIECRHIDAGEFDDIRNFPATVYINPEYEFRIAIKFFTIGEMQVPEPIKESPAKGVQCFVPSILTEELSKSFKWKNSASDLALMQRGQVHLIKEHAITHALALIAVSGGSLEAPTANDQNSTSNDVEKKTFESQSNIQIAEQGPAAAEDSLTEEIETDAVKLVEKFTSQLNAAETVDAVMQIRYQLSANGHMVRGQIIELNKLGEKRIEELTTPPSESKDLSVDELKRLQEDAESLIQSKKDESSEQPIQVDEDAVYKELLADLLDRVANATTPAEVNAQIKYTKSWTEEQRKPLIDAINKRLVELNPPKAQSSLAVRIQKAEDLTELDALEIDVSACDEEIQPRLMEMVEKRRLELDPFTAAIGEP